MENEGEIGLIRTPPKGVHRLASLLQALSPITIHQIWTKFEVLFRSSPEFSPALNDQP
jgi:hypothetical protein